MKTHHANVNRWTEYVRLGWLCRWRSSVFAIGHPALSRSLFTLTAVLLLAAFAPRAEAVGALGGTMRAYTENGTNFISHTFTQTGSNTLSILSAKPGDTMEVLLVAGGGGGGFDIGGGGGAGGLLYTNGIPVVVSNYTVIVGNGGAGGSSTTRADGYNGEDSVLGSLRAFGGGGGGGYPSHNGLGGGSGGGACSATVGACTNGQGNVGGTGDVNHGGGGGGAAQAGYASTSSNGKGGDGLQYSLKTGTLEYYAGGGGGNDDSGGGWGAGGQGGGGGGVNGGPGTPNTGGGGGANGGGSSAGSGGSGIVIVRYPRDSSGPAATGGDVVYTLTVGSTNYGVHIFFGTGVTNSFIPSQNLTVEYLIIGGGGAGGKNSDCGGGGGAGGYLCSVPGEMSGGGSNAENRLPVTSGISYPVTVGAGGVAASDAGGSGGNSFFTNIVAYGGGGGGGSGNGISGGSGGGSKNSNINAGSATNGQGYAGGKGATTGGDAAGGGGGAGGTGQAGQSASLAGNGGTGVVSSITGTAVGRAGGGGGGVYSSGTAGTASPNCGGGNGVGGGGTAGSGTQSTGGGGGGANTGTAGNGGSGIVVVRYVIVIPPAQVLPIITNLAASNVTATSASLNGSLSDTGTSATAVSVYWGPTDAGTNGGPAYWAHTNSFGNALSTGTYTTNTVDMGVTLTPNTTYYYNFFAENASGGVWAVTSGVSQSFTTFGAPIVAVSNATGIGVGSATLNGTLVSTNGYPTTFFFLWGTNNYGTGSTNPWTMVNCGAATNGQSFSTNLTGLTYGIKYWYYAYATNTYGASWSSPTNFLTAAPSLGLTNTSATSFTSTSATLQATLTGSNTYFDVWAYWGTTNGTNNASAWSSNAWVGGIAITGATTSSNLAYTAAVASNTTYYYTFFATNAATNVWASPSSVFGPPAVAVSNATGIGVGSATLQGRLLSSNGLPTTVFFCWGTNDYGTSQTNPWTVVNCGAATNGQSFSTNLTGLTYGIKYWYYAYATNTYGAAWSAPTNFVTAAAGGGVTLLASGGDSSYVTNLLGTNYGVHIFTNTVGTPNFTPSQNLTVEYLVVGGGGGGGTWSGNAGGGGGAGGYRCSVQGEMSGGGSNAEPAYSVLSGISYPVQVGGGGTSGSGPGTSSYFTNIVAYGGGGGGGNGAGSPGGSGGGSGNTSAGGSATNGQGYAGGAGIGSGYGGGGGGGAGTNGAPATGSGDSGLAGNGGTGVVSMITGTAVGRAGGGGGGDYNLGPAATASCGGGAGGVGTGAGNGSPGTDTYGGGGGGGGGSGGGGKGGSGIVIVRYAIPPPTPTIQNLAATNVLATSATLQGTLNGSNVYYDVWAFWGQTDGTNNAGAWASSNYVGGITLSGATTSSNIAYNASSGISQNHLHYYTFFASNAATNFWASPSTNFTSEALAGVPTLYTSGGPLAFGNVITNRTSTSQSYTLWGSNLTANVSVTAPTYFQIATNGGTYGQLVTLSTNVSGGLDVTTINVQFTPSNGSGPYAGYITNATAGFTNSVSLTGAGVVQTLYMGTETIAFGNWVTNTSSTVTNYTLWGSNLEANVTVTAPSASYAVSTNNATGFGQACTVTVANASTPSGGNLANTPIYVKFTPLAPGAFPGSITNSSTGAASQLKAVSGTGVVQTLYVSGTLAFGDVVVNTITASQSYTVTGSNLTANVTVSAPTNCQVSTSSGSGFGPSLTLTTNSAGNLAPTTVYVKFRPTTLGAYSANITNSSVGASNVLLAVTGNGAPLPAGIAATGGDSIYILNVLGTNYGVHIFNTVGTNYFVPNKTIANVQYLIIAGGGGGGRGGSESGGGGGAGGYRCSVPGEWSGGGASAESPITITAPSNYPVVVGAGGVGSASQSAQGGDGSPSSFAGISAAGGGGGGSGLTPAYDGRTGGSGGGNGDKGSSGLHSPGSGTANQGYSGGTNTSGGWTGAGGGGAGGPGGNGGNTGSDSGGNGGAGVTSSITGSAVARGGGGGGCDSSGAGTGGTATAGGGGGANDSGGTAVSGDANTGGGGGAATDATVGDGGSGVVIIRYPIPRVLTVVSAYAGAYPGTVTNADRTTLTESITNSPLTLGTTQYVCTGFSLTGNNYSDATATNVTLTLTNDATLTWSWKTQYGLSTTTNGNGTVTAAGSFYDAGSNVVLTATPGPHYHFGFWSGDTGACTIVGNVITAAMTQARTITANFVIDQHTLAVASDHGGVSPASPVTVDYGTTFTNSILNSPVTGAFTQYVCVAGAVVSNEFTPLDSTNVVVTLTNNATLTWTWTTNYWLTLVTVGVSGGVDRASGFYGLGSNVVVTATASNHYHLAGWSGDTNGCSGLGTTSITVPMSGPRTITNTFAIDQHTLTVVSDHGGVSPASPVTVDYGTTFTNAILNSPFEPAGLTTQYLCVAGTVVSNEFMPLDSTNVVVTLTNNATLTWAWTTNYWLTLQTTGSGSVDTSSQWVNVSSSKTVTATASAGWLMREWTGDTNGCGIAGKAITVPMTRQRTITAVFEPYSGTMYKFR